MYINKDYLNQLTSLITATPWRCNDEHLKGLLDFTESLVIEYEELNKEHSKLLTKHIQYTDMLRNQIVSL